MFEQSRFPRKEKTSRGKLFWDTHEASRLLPKDIESGKLKEMKPKDLRETRLEYQDFSVEDFCKHCHQELRSQREKPYWIPLRNELGLRKYNEEAAACKSDFDKRYAEEGMKNITEEFKNIVL